ncbi:MAG: hypothetical protein WAM14_02415 [Candidatus Nitrosopolaris sp.]
MIRRCNDGEGCDEIEKKYHIQVKHQISIAAADPPSDSGFIYDTSLVNLTRQKLGEIVGTSPSVLLSDMEEYHLVQSVFDEESKMKDSKYMKKFERSLHILHILEDPNFTVDSKADEPKATTPRNQL